MGYRSQIALIVTLPKKVSYDTMLSKFKKAWNDDDDFACCFRVSSDKNEYGRYLKLITKSDLKWYETYFKQVDDFMKIVREFEDTYKSGGLHYLRLGEDLTDVEEIIQGEPQEYVGFYRSLSVDDD